MISYLLVGDDLILFCDANMDQLLYMRMVLTCFEAATCSRVNLSKNEVVLAGNVRIFSELMDTLGCKIRSLPMI